MVRLGYDRDDLWLLGGVAQQNCSARVKHDESPPTYGRPEVHDILPALTNTNFITQGGAPPVISWLIIPINYRYYPHKP